MKKIIIIGSGIDGSGIGALIAKHQNAEVTLFEKNNIIGGRCGSYIKKDDQGRKWLFDVGCHTMATCDKGPLGTILKKIGKNDSVKWSYTRDPEPLQNFMGIEIQEKKKIKTKRISKRIRLIDEIVKMSDEEIEKWNYINLQDFFNEKLGSSGVMQKIIHSLQAGLCFGDLPAEISAGEYLKSMKINPPTSFGKIINWDKKSDEKWRECCLNSLISLWPDLEDHIIISDFYSTNILSARFGKEGVGIGISQSKDQAFEKRPSQISPIKGLFYCSADAGGWGIGTELAAESALEL